MSDGIISGVLVVACQAKNVYSHKKVRFSTIFININDSKRDTTLKSAVRLTNINDFNCDTTLKNSDLMNLKSLGYLETC